MIRTAPYIAAALALLWSADVVRAAPDLRHKIEVGPLQVYRDHESKELFYYAPGALELAHDRDGKPGLSFLQLRYVGTALYGDEGAKGSFSTLDLRFRMAGPTIAELGIMRRGIQKAVKRARIELRPLPITRFEAALVYATIGEASAPQALPSGFFEADDEKHSRSSRAGYWTERSYSIPLDERTSQLFWGALQQGELVMSLAYVFYTEGRGHDGDVFVSIERDSSDVMEMLLDRLGLSEPDALDQLAERLEQEADEKRSSKMIRSGALAVRVDAKRWPDLFRRVDFNDQAPPGYAHLKVYCYDFQNEIRRDLFYKKVEVAAVAVGGSEVRIAAKFLSSQPDLYARTLSFPVAVQLSEPYRYRVVSAHRDGRVIEGEWSERSAWNRILDVTTQAGESQSDSEFPPTGEPG